MFCGKFNMIWPTCYSIRICSNHRSSCWIKLL